MLLPVFFWYRSMLLSSRSEFIKSIKKAIEMSDILTLMDIFAVPYKAMVLRLLEEKIISDGRAREMIDIPFHKIKKANANDG